MNNSSKATIEPNSWAGRGRPPPSLSPAARPLLPMIQSLGGLFQGTEVFVSSWTLGRTTDVHRNPERADLNSVSLVLRPASTWIEGEGVRDWPFHASGAYTSNNGAPSHHLSICPFTAPRWLAARPCLDLVVFFTEEQRPTSHEPRNRLFPSWGDLPLVPRFMHEPFFLASPSRSLVKGAGRADIESSATCGRAPIYSQFPLFYYYDYYLLCDKESHRITSNISCTWKGCVVSPVLFFQPLSFAILSRKRIQYVEIKVSVVIRTHNKSWTAMRRGTSTRDSQADRQGKKQRVFALMPGSPPSLRDPTCLPSQCSSCRTPPEYAARAQHRL